MQISITIEGQEGLTWPLWKRFVTEIENLGYAGLFRSDHFPVDKAALELVVSLAYLALLPLADAEANRLLASVPEERRRKCW